ncbi:unnamed protein product [Nyctereutes procyonoides]|uniref:(raccoon dog) hypothetical protein n=1 Tax=Nyctereutes procyonoides TaxID=34880 RepID=A0A811Z2I1_NYCPR|nr:unnamed protein product [Nyctereutes procyonoides]
MVHPGTRFSRMGHQQLYWSTSSSTGAIPGNLARVLMFAMSTQTGTVGSRKMCLNMCCQCFCQYRKDIDFIKLD